nr:849_t:CDS:2 [Entrophospora candida]
MPMTENTSLCLSAVKEMFPEEWNVTCSAWSRANKPVMEISDLSEEESKDYLIKRCTIETKEGNKKNECKIKKEVDELYKLVGGCIVDLKAVVDKFLAGQSLEVGKHIISALLDSKELSFTTFMEFFNKTEESDEMLENNVFAYHPEKNTVTFQSQLVYSMSLMPFIAN